MQQVASFNTFPNEVDLGKVDSESSGFVFTLWIVLYIFEAKAEKEDTQTNKQTNFSLENQQPHSFHFIASSFISFN